MHACTDTHLDLYVQKLTTFTSWTSKALVCPAVSGHIYPVPLIEKSRASRPGGRLPRLICEVIILPGLHKLWLYVLTLKMGLDADGEWNRLRVTGWCVRSCPCFANQSERAVCFQCLSTYRYLCVRMVLNVSNHPVISKGLKPHNL